MENELKFLFTESEIAALPREIAEYYREKIVFQLDQEGDKLENYYFLLGFLAEFFEKRVEKKLVEKSLLFQD